MNTKCSIAIAGMLAGCAADVGGSAAAVGDLEGCFTEGGATQVVNQVAHIEDNATRGEALGTWAAVSTTQTASMTFTYDGDPAVLSELGSGTIRRQVGLKIRSQDPCNLVYVMWRLDDQQIAVQIKRNDGMSTSAECGNNGYTAIKYTRTNVPATSLGMTHTLSATLVNQSITVRIDGNLVWSGSLVTTNTPQGAPWGGETGWRTDNAMIDLDYGGVGTYLADCP